MLISRASSSFCSVDSFASQASLSNLGGSAMGAGAEDVGAAGEEDGAPFGDDFGWPKKDVMEPLALGFFAASAARSAALRLSDMFVSLFVT